MASKKFAALLDDDSWDPRCPTLGSGDVRTSVLDLDLNLDVDPSRQSTSCVFVPVAVPGVVGS
jgi:hypothetical protein